MLLKPGGRLLLVVWLLGTASWFISPYIYVADDCWFYVVIARNIATTGSQTFSGIFPTNGVHPLWLYLLSGYTYVCKLIDARLLKIASYAVPLSSALVLWGGFNLLRAARTLKLSPLLFAVVPVMFVLRFRRSQISNAIEA